MDNCHAADPSDSFYEDELESFDYYETTTTTSAKQKRQFLKRPQHRSNTNNSPQKQQERATTTDAATMAQRRHRKRRYQVYSQFLASSAELLQLDESQGKCFVPMLSKLLHPPPPGRKQQRPQPPPSASSNAHTFLEYQMDRVEHLRVFLESLGRGAGLRCLSMFLLQHLLHSATGYDARIRHAIKTVGVLVLLHDMLLEQQEDDDDDDDHDNHRIGSMQQQQLQLSPWTTERRGFWANPRHDPHMDLVTTATRKFESLEHFTALKLIELSKAQRELEMQQQRKGRRRQQPSGSASSAGHLASRDNMNGTSRDRIIRGLKIGGTAVAAGTLFAITGGLGTFALFGPCFGLLRFNSASLSKLSVDLHFRYCYYQRLRGLLLA